MARPASRSPPKFASPTWLPARAYLPEHAIKTMPQKARARREALFLRARQVRDRACRRAAIRSKWCAGSATRQACRQRRSRRRLANVRDFDIPVLQDLHASRWYSGNTHTHYHLEIDEDPDDRLRMVPPAEALDVSVISYLVRNDSPYITNRYPIGRLPQFSRDGTLMDMGEEARNNKGFVDFGYGHCLFLNIPQSDRAGLDRPAVAGRKSAGLPHDLHALRAGPAHRRNHHLGP